MWHKQSEWARIALAVAAIFHFLWGLLTLVYPSFVFSLTGAAQPEQFLFWQGLGIYSIAMAVGFACAARNPMQHWPVALVGLIASVALPAGAVWAIYRGQLPIAFGWVLALHDLIWVGPLAWILAEVHELSLGKKRHVSPEVRRMALRARTSEQMSLEEMTRRWPTMLVFLRHFGCPFCREAMTELARLRADIERTGTRVAFVHMASDAEAQAFFAKYGLNDLPRISDPSCVLYRAFGLTKGGLGQVLGLKAWLRGFQTGILRGHGIGGWFDDLFQMPGVFLLFHGEVLNSYLHQSISDRPNYLSILEPNFADESSVEVN